MNRVKIGCSDIEVSQFGIGMMRANSKSPSELRSFLDKALLLGVDFVDHADIYGGDNPSETLFGKVMKDEPSLRDKLVIQTKCGICSGYYDSSYEHIVESVNQSLKRMNVDNIDIILIHRPDALMEPEQMAKAFDELANAGKVRYFGVSNMNPSQIQLIQSCVKQPLITNQVEMSVVHAPAIDAGIHVNMMDEGAVMRDGDIINYSRLNGMTLQCWSILQISLQKGGFLGNESYKELNAVLDKLANKYGVSSAAVAVAWLLRHPAGLIPIAGTLNIDHLEQLAHAFDFVLTRQEWYEIYLSANRILP